MIAILLGLLFAFILFIAGQKDLPYEEEDELIEDEILLYYDEKEKDLLDDEDEHA